MSVNTTAADQVLISARGRMEGDNIPDETMEELTRRLVAEVDSSARAAEEVNTASTGSKQALSQSLAIGANELTFSWTELFPNTTYGVCFYATIDPGAPIRWWVKSKTTSQIVIGVVGHTAATAFSLIVTP